MRVRIYEPARTGTRFFWCVSGPNAIVKFMIQTVDPITITVPRKVLADIAQLSDELTGRMHQLLERNTDGELAPTERAELETLVRMAEFGQIVSMAIGAAAKP